MPPISEHFPDWRGRNVKNNLTRMKKRKFRKVKQINKTKGNIFVDAYCFNHLLLHKKNKKQKMSEDEMTENKATNV